MYDGSLAIEVAMRFNPNSRTDGRTLLIQTLADRSDGEESIVGGVHTTDRQPRSKKLGSYNVIVYDDGSLAIEL